MANEIPAEITELRELAATAASNLNMADQANRELRKERDDLEARLDASDVALAEADRAEATARRDYLAALRRHGYVQTADGPMKQETSSGFTPPRVFRDPA